MAESISKTHREYDARRFAWRQVRDCIAGSDVIKEANEVYLPMPSAMNLVTTSVSQSNGVGTNNFTNDRTDYQKQYLPYHHPNPAYSAYLQRARFPDITANSMRGIVGIASKYDPEVELPSQFSNLLSENNETGVGIEDLYFNTVSEILQVGKQVLVADWDESGQVSIIQYNAEANTDWEYVMINGMPEFTRLVLNEGDDKFLEYAYDNDALVVVNHYEKDVLTQTIELSYRGKRVTKIPAVSLGAINNTPCPGVIPLLGISDIAISIYQENADLRQGHYLTCNPTLFLFGVANGETPGVIGSSVIIGIKNPQGRAEYTKTDTSAFDHIQSYIKDLFQEAVSYGAAFLANPNSRESGEALQIRNASRGANLIHMVHMISSGYQNLLNIMCEIAGIQLTAKFEGNTDFAEMLLDSQTITALVTAWLQGAIDQDSLLNNMREAGFIDADDDNETIKQRIADQTPMTETLTPTPIPTPPPSPVGGQQNG